jgi:hypothetical protein
MAAKAVAGKAPQQRPARIVRQTLAPAAPEVLRFTSTSDEPEQREPLFYIDDVEYTILVNPPASIAQEALHILAEAGGGPVGQIMADDYVMGEMLGEDGWAALRSCKTVKPEQLAHLKQEVVKKAMGALEEVPNR